MGSTSALIEANSLRIDGGSSRVGPAIEGLSVTTTRTNVAVLGAPRAFFEAACGLRDVAHGTLRVCGLSPREALRSGAVASAPADPPFPARWTVLEFARENARLAGHGRRDSERLSTNALHALNLDAYAKARLGGVDVAILRAATLAGALATNAEALFVEDFTAGLPDGAARALARLFVSACEGKRWVLFAGHLALSSPLGLNANEALLFAGGRFVSAGEPAELASRERTFALRTMGDAAPTFAEKLRARGARVENGDRAESLTVTMPDNLTTHELVALAHAEDVVVLELLPLSGALA